MSVTVYKDDDEAYQICGLDRPRSCRSGEDDALRGGREPRQHVLDVFVPQRPKDERVAVHVVREVPASAT